MLACTQTDRRRRRPGDCHLADWRHLRPGVAQSSGLHPARGYAAGHWTARTGMPAGPRAHRPALRAQSAGYLHDVTHSVAMTTAAASTTSTT